MGIVAVMAAVLFNPLWSVAVMQRPFWTGHPLHWIREIVEPIPVLAFPLPGLAVAVCVLAYVRLRGQRSGLAVAATAIAIAWYVLLGGFALLMMVAMRGWNT